MELRGRKEQIALAVLLMIVVAAVIAYSVHESKAEQHRKDKADADTLLASPFNNINAFSFSKPYKNASDALALYQRVGDERGIANSYISPARTYEETEFRDEAWKCLSHAKKFSLGCPSGRI